MVVHRAEGMTRILPWLKARSFLSLASFGSQEKGKDSPAIPTSMGVDLRRGSRLGGW